MRSVVLSNRIRCLSQVAIFSLVGSLAVGCSSDSTRFDRALYSAVPKSAPNAYEQAIAKKQQYPGDVDSMTTSSIRKSGAPVPLSTVQPRIALSDDGSQYNTQPVQQTPSYQQSTYPTSQPNYQPVPAYKPAAVYKPAPTYNSAIVRGSALPQPSVIKQTAKRVAVDKINTASISTVGKVKKTISKKVIAPIVKPVKAAIAPVAAIAPIATPAITSMATNVVSQNSGGWSKIGGTAVKMSSGETLYNLSKRYGVPVTEIKSANSIKNTSDLKAGQNVIIPTYVYSKSAPISAPDNHPETRAARSSKGFFGQPKYTTIHSPTKRPKHASLVLPQPSNTNVQNDSQLDRSIITSSVAKAPKASVTSPSLNGTYVVKSGDSLSRIASKFGTKVSAIQSANGLSGSNIRVGQKLTLPTAHGNKVDPVSTGSVSKKPLNTTSTNNSSLVTKSSNEKHLASLDTKAPKSSGIKSMRWPVSGRVVSKFGARKKSGGNDGIDISVPEGTSVKAAENGVVIYSGSELAGFGNLVLIRHDSGFVTAYAYNKSLLVKKGTEVRRGQVIARSGRTGDAETPTLHFEVRKNSRPVNPIKYLGS